MKKVKKLNLKDVSGLVNQTTVFDVDFVHNGEEYQVKIVTRAMSYAETAPLYKRLANLENDVDLIPEWISQAIVDDKGETYLTVDDVKNTFPQKLAIAVFNKVIGLDDVVRDDEGKSL